MMTTAARNTTGAPAEEGKNKKPRKPYAISRPREKWTADEHDRFLHALLVFGRDWKAIEQFMGTKTATQIRSHAQKYFLKAHKLGLAAALPPPHPRRAVVLPPQQPPDDVRSRFFLDGCAATSSIMAPPPPLMLSSPTAGARWQRQQSVNWPAGAAARWPNRDEPFMATPNGGGAPSDEQAWFADCSLQDAAATVQLPLSPDDPRFAEVYRFVGDVFGSGSSQPVEAQLQRLHGVDPVVLETILLVLKNLQDNLCV